MNIYLEWLLFQHTTIVADADYLLDAPIIVGKKSASPYIYRGVG
jgi:hypothetical protein